MQLYDVRGEPTWVSGALTSDDPSVTIPLSLYRGENLCPECQGPPSRASTVVGAMASDLSGVTAGIANTNFQVQLPDLVWQEPVQFRLRVGP
jgi:hypothetical protein